MIPNSMRRILGSFILLLVVLGWVCQPVGASFRTGIIVKDKDELVKTLMTIFKGNKKDPDHFTVLRVAGGDMVWIRIENRLPVVYVAVVLELSEDHGKDSQLRQNLLEFPLKTRVKDPVLSYTLDATKVAELAGHFPSSVSMISQCVREEGTNKVTWAGSFLRFEFDNDDGLELYLDSLAPLLLDKKHGNAETSVSGSSAQEVGFFGGYASP